MGIFSSIKGWLGESILVLAKKIYLDGDVYRDINNVTLSTPEGTTQIDHIIVSPYGIFVIETKNMEGWIFGGEWRTTWTQSIYGKSFRFQNPIHQNYGHIKVLERLLGLPPEYFHSVVYFVGDSTVLKSKMPPNVMCNGLFTFIKSKRKQILTPSQVSFIFDHINKLMLPKTFLGLSTGETKAEHLTSLRKRHEVHERPSSLECPRCSGKLVVRKVKRGPNAGKQFYGCEQYPSCRFTREFA